MKIREKIFKTRLPDPNSFVGGVGIALNTRALLRAQLASAGATLRTTQMKNFRNDGPNNECSFFIRDQYPRMGYTASFISNPNLTYLVDEGGHIKAINQGAFNGASNFQRIHFPGVTGLLSPSGYFTLNGTGIKGWVSLPKLTGQESHMNHIFNGSKVTTFYMPLLTRIALQLASRTNFANITTLKRVYMPICQTLSSLTSSDIFLNVPAGTIMYLDPFLATNNGGGRDAHVVYWEDTRAAVIRYVDDLTAANPVVDLASANITVNSVDLTFTPPAPNVNGNDFYEVWIDDGVSRWMKYVSWQEVTGSGQTVTGLASATNYDIKIRNVDTLHNYSTFSNIINFTTL